MVSFCDKAIENRIKKEYDKLERVLTKPYAYWHARMIRRHIFAIQEACRSLHTLSETNKIMWMSSCQSWKSYFIHNSGSKMPLDMSALLLNFTSEFLRSIKKTIVYKDEEREEQLSI